MPMQWVMYFFVYLANLLSIILTLPFAMLQKRKIILYITMLLTIIWVYVAMQLKEDVIPFSEVSLNIEASICLLKDEL